MVLLPSGFKLKRKPMCAHRASIGTHEDHRPWWACRKQNGSNSLEKNNNVHSSQPNCLERCSRLWYWATLAMPTVTVALAGGVAVITGEPMWNPIKTEGKHIFWSALLPSGFNLEEHLFEMFTKLGKILFDIFLRNTFVLECVVAIWGQLEATPAQKHF